MAEPRSQYEQRFKDAGRAGAETQKDMADAGSELANRLSEMSLGQVRFAQDMVRIGVDAANRLMQCRDVDDAADVQRDYIKESVDRIFEEGKYIFRTSMDTLQKTQGAVQKAQHKN